MLNRAYGMLYLVNESLTLDRALWCVVNEGFTLDRAHGILYMVNEGFRLEKSRTKINKMCIKNKIKIIVPKC